MATLYRIGALALLLAGMMFGGNIAHHIDFLSILLIAGLLVTGVTSWCSWREFGEALKAGLGRESISHAHAVRHVSVLRTVRQIALASGFVGFFIGSILMLSHMDDPTQIGPACAVLLLTSLYAATVAELILGPLISGITGRAVGR